MQEYKIGGKITLEDNISYRIVDILKEENKEYLFCCTNQKPISPIIFEKVIYNNDVFLKQEKNPIIIQKLAVKSLKNSN